VFRNIFVKTSLFAILTYASMRPDIADTRILILLVGMLTGRRISLIPSLAFGSQLLPNPNSASHLGPS